MKLTDEQKKKYAKWSAVLTLVAGILTFLPALFFGLSAAEVFSSKVVNIASTIDVFLVGALGFVVRWLEQHVDPTRPAVEIPKPVKPPE